MASSTDIPAALHWLRGILRIRANAIEDIAGDVRAEPDPLADDLSTDGPRREVELHRREEVRRRGEGRLYE